jgi:hypothetical protein
MPQNYYADCVKKINYYADLLIFLKYQIYFKIYKHNFFCQFRNDEKVGGEVNNEREKYFLFIFIFLTFTTSLI